MNIIYLHQYFNTPQQSGGTRSYEMARRLVARGHSVEMVTTDRENIFSGWREREIDGIRVHATSIPYNNKMSFAERIKAFVGFIRKSANRAVSLEGDVVFATSTPLTIAIPGRMISKKKKIPMVFEVRDLWPEMPIAVGALKGALIPPARWLERYAYKRSKRIVALSPGMKEGIVNCGYPAEHVSVIPNSCDFHLFDVPDSEGEQFRKQHEWLGERPLVVYAGTFGFINSVAYLAKLAAEVKKQDDNIRFLAVGGGKEEELVRRTAQELGVLNDNFFVWPRIAKEEMPKVLSAATVATSLFRDVPEMWANSANKAFDAMAAGKPLVINHEGWHADRIRETESGLVLPPNDIESAADQLLKKIHDKTWVEQAGKQSRRVGRERYDRDKLALDLESVLIEAVDS